MSEMSELFALGRAADAAARAAGRGMGLFACCRRLLPTAAWHGPPAAGCSWVEEADVDALGGLSAARGAGADTLLATTLQGAAKAAHTGMRALLRLPFATEPGDDVAGLARLAAQVREGLPLDGVVPSPAGEPPGLATLVFFARCRLALPVAHVAVDLSRLGHKLGQLCLGFGADELFGPIVAERPPRLGAHAGSPEITRAEAVLLLRGAGLRACERLPGGVLRELAP